VVMFFFVFRRLERVRRVLNKEKASFLCGVWYFQGGLAKKSRRFRLSGMVGGGSGVHLCLKPSS